MQKICFSERYRLNNLVLIDYKTMTRRIAFDGVVENPVVGYSLECNEKGRYVLLDGEKRVAISKYKVGEEIAIAQRYKDIFDEAGLMFHENFEASNSKGYTNKLFVKPSLMPHRIKITNITCQRLQDITNADCLKEGIDKCDKEWGYWEEEGNGLNFYSFDTPHQAFAALIDKVSGKGTWEKNPWVFVYSFVKVK